MDFDANQLQKQGDGWTYGGQPIVGLSANTPRSEVIAALQSGSVQLPGVTQTARSGTSQSQQSGSSAG